MRVSRTIGCLQALVVASVLVGCAKVPHLEGPANVPVNDVVKRIKCDLVKVVRNKTLANPKFGFLSQWAAKVHLTLAVDDIGGVTPGATFIEPLAAAGTTFSLGLGGGLTSQAVRMIDIEFYLSFPEMFAEFKRLSSEVASRRYDDCRFEDGILLESDLDLKTVIDKALDPVEHGVLYPGTHPGGGAPPIPANEYSSYRKTLADLKLIKTPGVINFEATKLRNPDVTTFKNVERDFASQKSAASPEFNEALDRKKQEDLEAVAKNVEVAAKLDTNARAIVSNVVNPLYDVAQATLAKDCLGKVTEAKYYAVSAAAVVSYKKAAVDSASTRTESDAALAEEQEAFDKASHYAKDFIDKSTMCSKVPPTTKKEKPSMYDPIDAIGETVNFYVTLSGSIAPSWKLVRVTAPNGAALFTASRKITNTLIIAMSRPTPSDTGGPPTSKSMDNQILYSILSQAITPRP